MLRPAKRSDIQQVPLLAAAVKGALEVAQVQAESGHGLRVQLEIARDCVRVRILDLAPPVDPIARIKSTRDLLGFDPSDLPSLPERGMGLALMDEVRHRLTAEGNALELVRRL